jgi:riboflavin biosynthesis pyrimidine reductase
MQQQALFAEAAVDEDTDLRDAISAFSPVVVRIRQLSASHFALSETKVRERAALEDEGAEVILLDNAEGKVDLPGLVRELGQRQINELHVEAGAKLNGALIRAGCVDELLVYLAPALIGDGRNMFELPPLEDLSGKIGIHFHEVKQVGPDLRILARFD